MTSVRPSRGRAFLQGCAQLHTTADDDSSTSASARSPSPVVGARPSTVCAASRCSPSWRSTPATCRAATWASTSSSCCPGFLITSCSSLDDRSRRPIRPRRVLGPSGPSAAAGPAGLLVGRRDLAPCWRADRLELSRPRRRSGHARYVANWRQLVFAASTTGTPSGAVAAQPHLEPGDRGAVLRGVAAGHRCLDLLDGRAARPARAPPAPRPLIGHARASPSRRSSRSSCLHAPATDGHAGLPRHRHRAASSSSACAAVTRASDAAPPVVQPASGDWLHLLGAGRPRRPRRRVVRRHGTASWLYDGGSRAVQRRRARSMIAAAAPRRRRACSHPRPRVAPLVLHRTGQLRP